MNGVTKRTLSGLPIASVGDLEHAQTITAAIIKGKHAIRYILLFVR